MQGTVTKRRLPTLQTQCRGSVTRSYDSDSAAQSLQWSRTGTNILSGTSQSETFKLCSRSDRAQLAQCGPKWRTGQVECLSNTRVI